LESKNGTEPCTHVKSCYAESLQRQQQNNHPTKLIFGYEGIADNLVYLSVKGRDTSIFIQGFLDTLPSSATKDEITFVVTYRSPKIDHLRSVWKECTFKMKNRTSFWSSLLLGNINVK
jgi:hypothetical protein